MLNSELNQITLRLRCLFYLFFYGFLYMMPFWWLLFGWLPHSVVAVGSGVAFLYKSLIVSRYGKEPAAYSDGKVLNGGLGINIYRMDA